MAPLIAIRARKKEPSSRPQRQSPDAILLSPLHLPEILQLVFSFLSPHVINVSVRQVCKQWNTVARPLLPVRVLWKDRTSDKYKHSHVLNRLQDANILQVLFEQTWQLDNTTFAWRELMERVDTLRGDNQLHIRQLDLHRGNFLESRIYRILPKITTLTVLRIEKLVQRTIHVGTILALCPHLRVLLIECSGGYHEIEYETAPPTATTDDARAWPSQSSGLVSLTIKWMHLRQETLELAIKQCPSLQTLRLVELNRATTQVEPFDRVRLYSLVAETCPGLRKFHLSFLEQVLTVDEAKAMDQIFFPGLSLTRFEPGHLSATAQKQKRRQDPSPTPLDTLSLLSGDIHTYTVFYLRQPFIANLYTHRLTTLEIILSCAPKNLGVVSDALHQLLCDSPSLLHLVAPMVSYYSEYLDLEGDIDSEGYYKPRRSGPEFFRIKKQIWACRGLRTLDIQFEPALGRDSPTPENARNMFGYLARVCPDLRDLSIRRSELCLELEGGMCLLTRLRKLESLRIWTRTRTRFGKRDVEWMTELRTGPGHRNAARESARSWISRPLLAFLEKKRSQERTKHAADSPKGKGTKRDRSGCDTRASSNVDCEDDKVVEKQLTIEDMDGIGSLNELESWQRRETALRRGQHGSRVAAEDFENCWPRLEFLGLQFVLLKRDAVVKSEDHLPALFAKIRPRVAFSCNIERHPYLKDKGSERRL
ncbi:hypothetical protein EC968_007507 [Mortierella alpina]|nr:hypothetical protein EC968_007507 [Mortierella alpina]